MWLMTKLGFYSVVQKTPGEFHIRSRSRVDLENLMREAPPYAVLGSVIETPLNDYPFRLVTDQIGVGVAMEALANGISYSNFKDEAARRPDQRGKPYCSVWSVMRGGK